MTITPEGYVPRLLDPLLTRYMTTFGAVAIEGPKWSGKTWMGRNHANAMVRLDAPGEGEALRQLAHTAPETLLTSFDLPLLIDEWQEVPSLWDAVRHLVDSGHEPGRYLLTGSSTPRAVKPRHSGAGRFAKVRLHTLSSLESGASDGSCSLSALFEGAKPRASLRSLDVQKAIQLASIGGWPAIALRENPTAQQGQDFAQQYLDLTAEGDLQALGYERFSRRGMSALLRSLGRNAGTEVSQATLAADAGIDPRTVARYLEILRDQFLIEYTPAWSPRLRSTIRMRQAPKIWLTDPSLSVAALGATPEKLLFDLPTFGTIFETLCLRDLSVYATVLGARLFHYRDASGLEVDAIVEGPDGSWGAIEVKLGANQTDKASENLLRLSKKLVDRGEVSPSFLMVLTANGPTLQRPDGVVTASVATLGP